MTSDTFNGKFDSIKAGDRIGLVDGPGQRPADKVGKVYGKGVNRWGRWVRVKLPDYTFTTIHGLTEVGIGAYLLK